MRTNTDAGQLVDLGDAVVETKGTQRGLPDPLVGEKIGMGLTDDD